MRRGGKEEFTSASGIMSYSFIINFVVDNYNFKKLQ